MLTSCGRTGLLSASWHPCLLPAGVLATARRRCLAPTVLLGMFGHWYRVARRRKGRDWQVVFGHRFQFVILLPLEETKEPAERLDHEDITD